MAAGIKRLGRVGFVSPYCLVRASNSLTGKEMLGNLVGAEGLKQEGIKQNQEGKAQEAQGQLSDLGGGISDRYVLYYFCSYLHWHFLIQRRRILPLTTSVVQKAQLAEPLQA
jgi:hypothetical protein